MCNLVFPKHYLKSNVADFLYVRIHKMILFCYFITVQYINPQNNKDWSQLRNITIDVISEMRWLGVTLQWKSVSYLQATAVLTLMISFHFCISSTKNPKCCDFGGDTIMRLKFDFDETRNKAYVWYFEGLSVLLFTVDFILIKRNSISKKKIWSCWTNFYREKKIFSIVN